MTKYYSLIFVSLVGFSFTLPTSPEKPASTSISPVPYDYDFYECFPSGHWSELLQKNPDKDPEYGMEILSEKDFEKLTVADLISFYNNPEEFSQNCEPSEIDLTVRMEIPKYLYDNNDEASNSQRQVAALHKNRDSVLLLVGNCGREHGRFGDVMKRIIIELNGYELIPDLMNVYNNLEIKESSYLTVLIRIMMEDEDHKAFEKSSVYKLYSNDMDAIPYTEKIELEILELAKAYYAQKKK